MTDYKGKVEQDSRTEKGSNSTMKLRILGR